MQYTYRVESIQKSKKTTNNPNEEQNVYSSNKDKREYDDNMIFYNMFEKKVFENRCKL